LEKSRNNVQEACLLAWSIGPDSFDSKVAQELLVDMRNQLSGRISRNLAIALVRKQGFAPELNLEELARLIAPLGDDPPWLRAEAIRVWAAANKNLDLATAKQLWDLAGFPNQEMDPRSLGESYHLAELLGGDRPASVAASYCAPQLGGFTLGRCLRFLSAVSGLGLEDNLRRFLPPRNDNSWRFFQRTFPERASNLDQYL
jgi:hypothetical protein